MSLQSLASTGCHFELFIIDGDWLSYGWRGKHGMGVLDFIANMCNRLLLLR